MEILKVLVLGATGRIGGILRRCWPEMVPNLAPDLAPGLHVVWQTRGTPPAGWLGLDPLADPQALAAAVGAADVVLCLAGVTPAAAAKGADMADNSALAQAVIRAAGQGRASAYPRVFLASSAAVYGRDPGPLEDSRPPQTLTPVAPYGEAKVRMEMDAQKLGEKLGVPVCALRIGNVAGADAILGGWRPGFRLDRFADGRTPRRSYIGPRTLARVLADLIRAGNTTRDLPPAINIACPGSIEMGDLLDAAVLAWSAQNAPNFAIPEVQLSTSAIETFTRFSEVECQAQGMVEQWRALGTHT